MENDKNKYQLSRFGLHNKLTASLPKSKTPYFNECHGYDTKYLIVSHQFCCFEECGVTFHIHNSQLHTDPE